MQGMHDTMSKVAAVRAYIDGGQSEGGLAGPGLPPFRPPPHTSVGWMMHRGQGTSPAHVRTSLSLLCISCASAGRIWQR